MRTDAYGGGWHEGCFTELWNDFPMYLTIKQRSKQRIERKMAHSVYCIHTLSDEFFDRIWEYGLGGYRKQTT